MNPLRGAASWEEQVHYWMESGSLHLTPFPSWSFLLLAGDKGVIIQCSTPGSYIIMYEL